MTQLPVEAGAGIGEEEVAQSAPFVRALAVQRLEQIWAAVEPHILVSREDRELGVRPDPRFVEAGIRVIDRLGAIYGLLRPARASEGTGFEGQDELRAAAAEQIRQLEQKMKGEQPG
jgi:hypothetical protein